MMPPNRMLAAVYWIVALIEFVPTVSAWMHPSRMTALKQTPPSRTGSADNSIVTVFSSTAHEPDVETTSEKDEQSTTEDRRNRLQGKLLKDMREICRDYQMIEEGDHIMVCASGGKDSATLLYLFLLLQQRLPVNFEITAVHVDQKQPGYNGTALVQWLESDLQVNYKVVEEDTYSVVLDKTKPGKSYCAVCSRLRRGILYTTALDLGCNKIALGHHADDCLETLLMNMIHGGVMKAMPARYTSKRGSLAVMRPLIACKEEDIAEYAALQHFPILPCNLCSSQEGELQRPAVKLLLQTLQGMNPSAGKNMLRSCQDIRPSHLLDQSLREACGMNPVTGEVVDDDDAHINA